MTPRFTDKLDRLGDTMALLSDFDTSGLETALRTARYRHAYAIGSGGSAISAEFFARCRETLAHGPTTVMTPMAFVLGSADVTRSDVWLFTAGAENPDVIAAGRAAVSRRGASVHVVTRGPDGPAAREALDHGGHVHAVPVAEPKDGYLATHSLVATVASLLLAADRASDDGLGPDLFPRLIARLKDILSPSNRAKCRQSFETLDRRDTLIMVADPQLRAVSTLIETSAWEAGICAVQYTDFRNFGHGRHAWLHHRGDRTVLLALTGVDSRPVWLPLREALPTGQRRLEFDFGDCGRFANAVGVVDGLVLLEAMGAAVGIDPGKPGVGPFGAAMYESDALLRVSFQLSPSVRQKRSAMLARDDPAHAGTCLSSVAGERLRMLGEAVFGGLVLDYDGTIVSTEGRYSPPTPAMVAELDRLLRAGLRLGVATGRGGSAGKDLRQVLHASVHPAVTMGYYNGAHLTQLDIDIRQHRPLPDPGITEAIAWMEERQDLFRRYEKPEPGVQVTIQLDDLAHPERFALDARECSAVADGRVRIARSGHSFDIVVARATKLSVVVATAGRLDHGLAVLSIGDSGSRHGNDNALLSTTFGISVGDVCGVPDGCWSLFGERLMGPAALLEVLRALRHSGPGEFRLDLAALPLERC